MAQTPIPYDAICAAARRRCHDRGDGALSAVFLDRRRAVVLTVGFDEGTGCVDELYLRHLAAIVTDTQVAEVVFAVVRTDGRPTRVDRLLWRELRPRLADASTALCDLIVVGESQRWSARSGHTTPIQDAPNESLVG